MAAWKFVVTDLAGRAIGEPTAFDKRVSVGVSKTATAAFRINSTDSLWDQVAGGSSMLRVFDSGGNDALYGPIIADEESGDQNGKITVQFTAADLTWRFAKRYVGRDTTGIGVVETGVDAGQIAYDGLNLINADEATGVTTGIKDSFVPYTATFLWKRYLDLLSELGAIAGSYEWALRYTNVGAQVAPTAQLDLKAALGTDRTRGSSAVFFEYGTGSKANCKAYSRTRTIDQLASDVWVLGGASTLVTSASDPGRPYKRHEDVITYGDIVSASLLDALAAAHVAIRKQPRIVATLTPFPSLTPKYGVDYMLGDLVNARIDAGGKSRLSGPVRVWGADIAIDEFGMEQPTLTLAPSS